METSHAPSHADSTQMSVTNMTARSSENSKSPITQSQSRVQVAGGSQKGIFFLISRRVTVSYGPYMNLGVLDYRTERLDGLMKALKKIGGEPVLKPSYHLNRVRVWHLEHEIFSCKITDLQHGGDGDLDRLSMEAARCLDRSSRKAHYNMKARYKLELHLNEGCPCHPPPLESHHHLGGHQHSSHHGDTTNSSFIGSADSKKDDSIHSGHGGKGHGHKHHHAHNHGGEHHHHGHHHQSLHNQESQSRINDDDQPLVGGEPRPPRGSQLPNQL